MSKYSELMSMANAAAGGGNASASKQPEQKVNNVRGTQSTPASSAQKPRTIEETMELLGVGQKKDRYSFKAEQEERRAQQSMRQTVPETKKAAGKKPADWLGTLKYGARRGITAADNSVAKGIDWLVGGVADELHALGQSTLQSLGIDSDYFNGKDTLLDKYIAEGERRMEAQGRLRDEAAGDSKAAQKVGQYTEMVANSLPMSVMALLSGGTAAAPQASTAALKAASSIANSGKAWQAVKPIADAAVSMLKNPNWGFTFASTVGSSYDDAIADGASEDAASMYAILNAAFNATTEIGGTDDVLGGLQKLPVQLRKALEAGDKNLALRIIKNMPSEIGEEIVQGIGERGLKSLYKDVPLVSTTDENAMFNPRSALEEAKGAAVVSAVLGGGQAAIQTAANAAANQMARRQTARTATPVQENIPAADAADVMEQTAPVQSSAETGTQEAKPGARENAKATREQIIARTEAILKKNDARVNRGSEPVEWARQSPLELYEEIKSNEPELLEDVAELKVMRPDVPRGRFDGKTMQQIEEDPVEWKRYDARRKELEEKYGVDRVWALDDILEAGTLPQLQKVQTPKVSPQGRALVEGILSSGRVNATTADAILSSPELTQAFIELTGRTPAGNTESQRKEISRGAREYAYSQIQAQRDAEQAEIVRREQAMQAEQERAAQEKALADYSAQEAARDAEWTAHRQELENYDSYDSYIRGAIRNGMSFAEAGEIARTPKLRSTWERMTGQTLPESTTKAREAIMNYHADAATPGKTFNAVDALADYGKPTETAQARTETQGDNPAPAKAESVKQAGSDVLNSVLNLNSKNTQPKMTTGQIYNEYFAPKTQPKPADNGTKAQKNTASTEETGNDGGLIQRVKSMLSKAKTEQQRNDAISNMNFGETSAAIENGMVSRAEIPFATVSNTTPQILVDRAGAQNLPIIMDYSSVYLAAKKAGELPGHYHDLGADIMAEIPGKLNDPALMVKLENGRINEVVQLTDKKGNPILVSLELSTVKNLGGSFNAYNLMLTAFGAKGNYINKLVSNPNNTVLINNLPGATSQVNPQLNKLPGVINEAASGSTNASLDGARRLPSDGSIPGGVSSEASEASASTTSIPTKTQNVKGENAGNAEGVFEPVYNRNAKPYTEEKLSKFWTNTLNETERAAGTPGEASQPLSYMPKTEKQSLGEAASRLSADRQGEIERLVSAEAWSGVQVDAAASVAADLYREAKTTGNYEAYTAWRKVMQEHITSGGQGVQALAKYSRHSGENALSSIAEMIADSGLSPEQKKALINKVGDYAQRFDDITRGIPDNDVSTAGNKGRKAPTKKLVSLIEDMAHERGTWTFKDDVYSDLLSKQNDAYLKEYAYRQILAMGNDSLAKASVADKAKSVQSMMQLTSIATFARNIGGNTTFGAVDTMTQDGFGVALDFLLSKATGKRTVGVDKGWFSSEARNGAVDAMQKSILEVAGDIDMEGEMNRYGQTSGRAFKMDSSPTDRFFSRWQQIMGYSLTTSDKFSRGAIEAEQLRGLGAIKDSGLTNEEMQALAKAMADYRLFQNQGAAYGISKAAHDYANVVGFGGEVEQGRRTGGFGLGDFINTYPGVPANLGVKVLEYSPANIVKGGAEMIDVIIKAKQGKVDVLKQQQAVMDVARGLAGVPAFALFAALTKAGFIRNWDDEDDADVKAQNAAEGKTGIQFNLDGALRYLNGDKSFEWRNGDRLDSIGWLEPINGFMAVGSLMANEPEAASKWAYVGDIAVGAVQAFLDIPVMSNISDIVDTFQYSKADTVLGKAGEAAAKYAGNMATSFMPSPVRGVAKGLDPYYRDTTGDTAAETAWNQFKLTVPGLRETLPVKQDNFGQPKMYSGNTAERLFDTLVNPGTRTKIRQSDASKVLEDLYKATGDAAIYPDRKAPNSIDVDGEKEALTSAEKREYQRTAGGMSANLIESLADNELYKTADNEEKADIVKELLSYSEDMAKKKWGDSKGKDIESNSWEKVFAAQIPDVPGYVASKQALQKAKTKPGKTDFDYLDKVLGNYRNLSPQSQELLSSEDLNVNKLLYADALGIGSKDYYAASKAVSDGKAKLGTSDVAKAISVYNNMRGKSDSEILSAIKAQVPPAKGGKQSSTVRRIEAYSKLAGDDADLGKWLELCASLSDADENSSVTKADVYTAWANMGLGPKDKYAGIDRNGFYNIVKSSKSLASNPDYATQIDEVYALLVPAEEKTKPKLTGTVQGGATGSKSVQHWSYEDIMESLGLAAKK